MIKRTLHFGNPAHLSTRNSQLIVELKNEDRSSSSIPIEDIGIMVLEHPQITLTTSLLEKLLEQQVALVSCNSQYLPSGMFLPLDGNSVQTERIRTQIAASLPLKKQLWQQTIRMKILNQARVLEAAGLSPTRLELLAEKVQSGDPRNCEAQAAAYYWTELYGSSFIRGRTMTSPNAQLNYGYAILRSVTARALTASGLLPTLGIHHKNKYNSYCLADDMMEPYRPFVDWMVLTMDFPLNDDGLTKEQKIQLLQLPQLDVLVGKRKRPLFHAVSSTTASLYKCFAGESRKLKLPLFNAFEDNESLPF